MKPKLDMNKIAKGLGAERRGPWRPVEAILAPCSSPLKFRPGFRTPVRATDPSWTERRLVPLAPRPSVSWSTSLRSAERNKGLRLSLFSLLDSCSRKLPSTSKIERRESSPDLAASGEHPADQ